MINTRHSLCLTAAAAIALMVQPAPADELDSWNNAALDSIRAENIHPCVAARALAILHGTLYDVAANVMQQRPFFASESSPADPDLIAAFHSAAHTTLTNLFPSRTAQFNQLYRELLRNSPETRHHPASLRFGRAVADAWITWRAADSSSGSLVYVPDQQPGAWRRTPPYHRPPEMQHWARVLPFTMISAAQFRPSGPPALESQKYGDDFNLVKSLGAAHSSERTREQTDIALFWSDFSYTVTPPGHWNQIAQSVAASRGMSLEKKVRLFAALNIAMADVAVACWDAKFVFNFWRPVTAIRAAGRDSNPATQPQEDWSSLLANPAFPEYVSGHSAFSAAGATILARFNDGDTVAFSVPSDSLPGQIRKYDSLWACAREVSQSRLYGGIHFPSALDDGLALGRKIAHHVLDNFFSTFEAGPRLFTAPGELNRPPWIGVSTLPGRRVAVERVDADGRWNLWTNGIASAPVLRWHLDDLTPASAFRLRAD